MYLLGLTPAIGSALGRRSFSLGEGMAFYLGVLGLGLFSYYQGRSHPVVLLLCCWPAVILALWLGDRILAAVRYRLLPRWCAVSALPVLLLAAACALCLWQSRVTIVTENRARLQAGRHPPSEVLAEPQIGYVKQIIARGGSCAIISQFQSIYYAATGLCPGLTGCSVYECLLKVDLEGILSQLRARKVQHLLTEYASLDGSGFYLLDPEYGRVMSNYYHPVDASPDGRLVHWEPRSNEELGADPMGAYRRDFRRCVRLDDTAVTQLHAVRFASANVLLDPEGQCVSAPYHCSKLIMGKAWTFEMLLTPAVSQTPSACLISTHPTPYAGGIVVEQFDKPEQYNGFFGDGHSYVSGEPFTLSANHEHYLAITYEANTVRIFVDGTPQSPIVLQNSLQESNLPLIIGNWINNDRRFQGEIAEVRFSTQALSAEAIASTQAKLRGGNEP